MEANDIVSGVKDRLISKRRGQGDEDDEKRGSGPTRPEVQEISQADRNEVQIAAQQAYQQLLAFMEDAVAPNGLDADMWSERWSEDAGELSEILEQLSDLNDSFLNGKAEALELLTDDDTPTNSLSSMLRRTLDFHHNLLVLLQLAQKAHRDLNARRKRSASDADAGDEEETQSVYVAGPLRAIPQRYDPKDKAWLTAQQRVAKARCVFIAKPTAVRISALFGEYTRVWDSASSDGFKGAKMVKFRRMTEILEEVANLLVENENILTHASCCPGTLFYDMFMKLLKQSCSSREVMSLQRWWDSIAKDPS